MRHLSEVSWVGFFGYRRNGARISKIGRWLTCGLGTTGTLCCETADEAKTLIPSLAQKISDADLQELLKEITNLRAFVE